MVRMVFRRRLRDDWPLLVLALACAMAGIVFTEFAAYVLEGSLTSLDQSVRGATQAGRPPALVAIFDAISWLGRTDRIAVIAGLFGLLLLPRQWTWPVLLALCAVATNATVDWLKDSFQVTRPEGGLAASSHSFPSGHASGSMAVVVFLSFVAARHRRSWIFPVVAVLSGVLVGVSRVYLDRHWASDVVGGWIVGAAFGTAFAAIHEWVLRHQRPVSPSESVPSGPGATRN